MGGNSAPAVIILQVRSAILDILLHYAEKVLRGPKIAKFDVLTFANDLLQLISYKINFCDQRKRCILRGANFRD